MLILFPIIASQKIIVMDSHGRRRHIHRYSCYAIIVDNFMSYCEMNGSDLKYVYIIMSKRHIFSSTLSFLNKYSFLLQTNQHFNFPLAYLVATVVPYVWPRYYTYSILLNPFNVVFTFRNVYICGKCLFLLAYIVHILDIHTPAA